MTRLAALTGATGFVGGHVMAALAARGWRLRILARRWPGPPPALAATPIEVVQGDLADEAALTTLLRGADAVVHMAGAIRAADPAVFARVNLGGTERLLRARAAAALPSRLLALSSMAAREPALSPYAASKRAAEAAIRRDAGGDWRILRPSAVYGPLDRETLRVFRMADAPLQVTPQGGAARLCLIHAADLARAVAALLDHPGGGETFELTDSRVEGYPWPEIAATAARALGRRPRPLRAPAPLVRLLGRVGDLSARLGGDLPDSAKMREALHPDWSSAPAAQPPRAVWTPRIGLDEGFRGTVAAYRRAGLLKRRLETPPPSDDLPADAPRPSLERETSGTMEVR